MHIDHRLSVQPYSAACQNCPGIVCPMITVIFISIVLVLTCVGIHYFALVNLSLLRSRGTAHPRRWLNLMVLGAIIAHVTEILVFALGYRVVAANDKLGGLHHASGGDSEDFGYFSFVAYTSLGFGDILPHGELRFMTALETLTGLLLIAWTASFIFLEMQATWDQEKQGM